MKTPAAALLGLLACIQFSSGSTITVDEGRFKKVYFRDIWGMYHLEPDSVPARVYLQWLYPSISAGVLAVSTVSDPTQLVTLSYPPPVMNLASTSEPENTVSEVMFVHMTHGEVHIAHQPVIPTHVVPDGGSTLILFSGALGILWWSQRRGTLSPKIG